MGKRASSRPHPSAIWLQDYGSQFGFRLGMSSPDCVAGLITQNGDIYEDAFGPKYDFLKESWENPGPAARRTIALHWSLMSTLHWFAREQAHLRESNRLRSSCGALTTATCLRRPGWHT